MTNDTYLKIANLNLLNFFQVKSTFPLSDVLQGLQPTGGGQAMGQGHSLLWQGPETEGDQPAINPNPCTAELVSRLHLV